MDARLCGDTLFLVDTRLYDDTFFLVETRLCDGTFFLIDICSRVFFRYFTVDESMTSAVGARADAQDCRIQYIILYNIVYYIV